MKKISREEGPTWRRISEQRLVLSIRLVDWGETNAEHGIALTEYFLEHCNIDSDPVYLHGMAVRGALGEPIINTASVEKRVDDFNEMVYDETVKMIFLGGTAYGVYPQYSPGFAGTPEEKSDGDKAGNRYKRVRDRLDRC